jgi:ribonuclease HI
VIASAAGRLDHVSNALQAEAMACLQAVLAAHDLGVQQIEFESDALMLVQAVISDDFDRAENGVLFKEIKRLLPLFFTFFSVKHCPRACNKVANALASFGAKLVHHPLVVWQGDVPCCAWVFVASDISVISG